MSRLDVGRFKAMFAAALEAVRQHTGEFSALDAVAGDGDHGTAVVSALTAADREVRNGLDLKAMLADAALAAMSESCGSTSTLLGALLLGMSDGVQASELDAEATAAMFASGLANVRRQTKAAVGDRTLMDALIPAVEAMQGCAADGLPPMFAAAAEAAAGGAEKTKNMVARFGRARNLGDRVLGHVDPGAASMACIFQAFAQGCGD